MEIFIVGAVVVALMVFISTKIKRSAARAFVAETVEKDEFTIDKPDGFMSPVDGNREYEFEAYSRDFGEKKMRNVWQAHARLTTFSGLNLEIERERVKNSAAKISSERIFDGDSDVKICLLETEEADNDFPAVVFRKIVESRSREKTYSLQISVLREYREVYIKRTNEMINSFRLK